MASDRNIVFEKTFLASVDIAEFKTLDHQTYKTAIYFSPLTEDSSFEIRTLLIF